MVGIKPSSPGMNQSMSADMVLDLTTMSAPSGARSARRGHPQGSSALGYAAAASAVHSPRVYGACTAEPEAAASEALGLSVGGCPRARSQIWALGRAFEHACRPVSGRASRLKNASLAEASLWA